MDASVDVELDCPFVVDCVDVELSVGFGSSITNPSMTISRMRVPSIGTLMLKECLKSAMNTSFF